MIFQTTTYCVEAIELISKHKIAVLVLHVSAKVKWLNFDQGKARPKKSSKPRPPTHFLESKMSEATESVSLKVQVGSLLSEYSSLVRQYFISVNSLIESPNLPIENTPDYITKQIIAVDAKLQQAVQKSTHCSSILHSLLSSQPLTFP
jgi:hypothetical protein